MNNKTASHCGAPGAPTVCFLWLVPCALLFACAEPSEDTQPDGASIADMAPRDAATDAVEPVDAPLDGPEDSMATDAEPMPVDCSAIEMNGQWQVCESTPTSCAAVFTDSAGCVEVCAAAGLACAQVFEDVDDACQPDRTLPELDCTDTGHISDYCVCGEPPASRCGDGICDPAETCTVCEPDCGGCLPDDYRSLVDDAVGFARPTGGRDGPRVWVTNLNASGRGSLVEALSTAGPKWISFEEGLRGTISPERALRVPADTTIDGRGADITLARGLQMRGVSATNIIIHNLRFDITENEDGVTVRDGADQIWVDHCTFESWGDGAIDVTNGIAESNTRVTVSFVRLIGGSKGMLISASSDPSLGHSDENLYVTHHHNQYLGVSERLPRARFAKVHVFNNFYDEWRRYAIGASTLSEVLVQNNIFDADSSDQACIVQCIGADCDFHGAAPGALRAVDNTLDQGPTPAVCETGGEDRVFDEFPGSAPPYPYTLEMADDALRQKILREAGWREIPSPP